jgi:chromosome segregation ATPase
MVEPLLYAALGFLTASLVALFMGRALWNRAVRLTTHRIMRRLPLSRDEIVASRDLLRAEVAIEHRKLERQVNIMREKMTQSMADVGRRDTANLALRNALSEANSKLAAADVRDKDGSDTIGTLRHEVESFKARLAEMKAGLAEEQRKVRARERERTEIEFTANQRQADLQAASVEIKQMKLTAETLQNQLETTKKELAEAQGRLEKASTAARDETQRADAVQKLLATNEKKADIGAEDISALRQQIEWLAIDLARITASNGSAASPANATSPASPASPANPAEPSPEQAARQQQTSVEADIFGS